MQLQSHQRVESVKLIGHGVDAAKTVGQSTKRRLFITDSITNITYLVDCGADVSVLPPTHVTQNKLCELAVTPEILIAANHSPIAVHGSLTETVTFKGKQFKHSFIIADVSKPLLGADFLYDHNLLIDIRNCQLIDCNNNHYFKCQSRSALATDTQL